jgi:hypothetical protein
MVHGFALLRITVQMESYLNIQLKIGKYIFNNILRKL